MIQIEFNGNTYKVTHKRQGIARPWDDTMEREHHRIFVQVDGTTQKVQFSYYCRQRDLDVSEQRFAVYCMLTDAMAFMEYRDAPLYEFAREFGYTDDDSQALRVYHGCRRNYEKSLVLGLSDSDIYKFANYLQEKYDF